MTWLVCNIRLLISCGTVSVRGRRQIKEFFFYEHNPNQSRSMFSHKTIIKQKYLEIIRNLVSNLWKQVIWIMPKSNIMGGHFHQF